MCTAEIKVPHKVEIEPKMQLGSKLYVYKGEWGLPSIDFECMRALVSSVAS